MTSTELALPTSADQRGWTPQQWNLMVFAGLAQKIQREGQTVWEVVDPGVAEAFLAVCRRTGLDPFAKQIYAMNVGGRLSIVVGVDGFRIIAQRSQGYRGQVGPQWTRDGSTWVDAWLPELQGGAKGEKPAAARIGILREGFSEPLWQVVTWAEFGVDGRNGKDNWNVRPAHMLGIRAETHGLRRTFPNDLSGLYTPEDFEGEHGEEVALEVAETDRHLIELINAETDEAELKRAFFAHNAVGMSDDVRAAFMARGGYLTAEAAKRRERDAAPPHDGETGEVDPETPADPSQPVSEAHSEAPPAEPAESDEERFERQSAADHAAYLAEHGEPTGE